MMAKRVVLLPAVEQDIADILAYCKQQGGVSLSIQWAEAVEAALRYVGSHPASGSPRYAGMLGLSGLRFWRIRKFPYLVFYVEHAEHVDVWRALHAERDIPHWLVETE